MRRLLWKGQAGWSLLGWRHAAQLTFCVCLWAREGGAGGGETCTCMLCMTVCIDCEVPPFRLWSQRHNGNFAARRTFAVYYHPTLNPLGIPPPGKPQK